jgi:hypothetical protein
METLTRHQLRANLCHRGRLSARWLYANASISLKINFMFVMFWFTLTQPSQVAAENPRHLDQLLVTRPS